MSSRKFEYMVKIVYCGSRQPGEELESLLTNWVNGLAEQGWEYCGPLHQMNLESGRLNPPIQTPITFALFRRPKG